MVNIELQLPNDWFKSEIINNHYVSREKKEIWAIELDMLYKVQQICDKYNIKYWVDGGTLLGAVRHKGFIPWDDDIDIMMLRDDYDKFIKVAQTELSDPYFLQTDWTDNVFYCHAKIRRSDTTCVLEKDLSAKFEFNQGIFIDIFPFDNVPTDEKEYNEFISYLNLIKTEILTLRTRWWMYERQNEKLLKRCQQLRDEYEKVRKKYNNKNEKFIANLGLPTFSQDIRKERKCFDMSIKADFATLKVPIPLDFQTILSRLYGDYMTPVHGKSNH